MILFYSGGTRDNNHWKTPESFGLPIMLTWYQILTGHSSDTAKKYRTDTTRRFAARRKRREDLLQR